MNKRASRAKQIDLVGIAEDTMQDEGFITRFDDKVRREVEALPTHIPEPLKQGIRDLRELAWSSIDNETSRDLDQVEYAEALPGGDTRLMIGVADVDAYVPRGSAIDKHAGANGTSVYTGVKVFPMLPEELSTDLTSLNPGEDRLAIITEMVVAHDGVVKSAEIYRALVNNHKRLTYPVVGKWLDGKTDVPEDVKEVPGLEEQLRLQAESAKDFRELRKLHGALELDTIQATAVVDDRGRVTELATTEPNAARDIIANFMIAANVAMAQFLEAKRVPSLRRIVRTPKFWDRIVEIAEELGEKLPPEPDSRALAAFLAEQKATDPVHFPDLSLAIVKALGPGEYTVQLPDEPDQGHFGLAVQDYTHSTAPNRRYADLITQRLLKAALSGKPSPYTIDELERIAEQCTDRDSAARKVERKMRKSAAAVLLRDKIGDEFKAIVTGVTPKGTFARILTPPVDGRVMRGERNMRVGDKVRVRLLGADPERGFIDFARA